MENNTPFQTTPTQPEKRYPFVGVVFLCLSAVYALCINLLPFTKLLVIVSVLFSVFLVLAVPVLTVILIVQAVRHRRWNVYWKNCILSVLFSIGLIVGGWAIQPYTERGLTDFVTNMRIRSYQFVVDKIHSGEIEQGIAYSVGGQPGHEDVAFCIHAIRFGASEFFVYSEDSFIEAELILEYDIKDRTHEPLGENWYRIIIED